jgi:hypothetical protein
VCLNECFPIIVGLLSVLLARLCGGLRRLRLKLKCKFAEKNVVGIKIVTLARDCGEKSMLVLQAG